MALLPLPAALADPNGNLVATTPEWQGAGLEVVAYRAGHGSLLVGAVSPPPPGVESLVDQLLGEVERAAAATSSDSARTSRVLAAGLRLVAGKPVGREGTAGVQDLFELVDAAVRARTQGLRMEFVPTVRELTIEAPASLALALVQLAVNARTHDGATTVRISVEPGPVFEVEWHSDRTQPVTPRTHRHQRDRSRWGWGYVRMVADLLGGAAIPPRAKGDGYMGAAISLGSRSLTLPLGVMNADGKVLRRTSSWAQEILRSDPREAAVVTTNLARLVSAARRSPGAIVYWDLYSARTTEGETWMALPPETGTNRAVDVLRGLDHERSLWAAPEPHATRVAALTRLLQRTLGEPWPGFDPASWARLFPAACTALGITPSPLTGALVFPDPRVAALLLAEVGGELVVADGGVSFRPKPEASGVLYESLRLGRDAIGLTPDL